MLTRIKEMLKYNKLILRIYRKFATYSEFLRDGADYDKYNLDSAKRKGAYAYQIMLLVHNIEKGMCMPNLRRFGLEKVSDLMTILGKYDAKRRNEFEYNLGLSALKAWVEFYEDHGWNDEPMIKTVKQFMGTFPNEFYDVGCEVFKNPSIVISNNSQAEQQMLLSRHSVRDYSEKEISDGDLQFALQHFAIAPTACNRQMCKVIQVKNHRIKGILHHAIVGLHGFNQDKLNYFIITYDMASLSYLEERYQGFLNSGLVAMNFVNGLHMRGIGSCFLQWSNKRSEDAKVRKELQLLDSERIAVVISAGYYKEEDIVPCSCRKPMENVFRIIE
jgi:nitroreductase